MNVIVFISYIHYNNGRQISHHGAISNDLRCAGNLIVHLIAYPRKIVYSLAVRDVENDFCLGGKIATFNDLYFVNDVFLFSL